MSKPEPAFDRVGYPTTETLVTIAKWPYPFEGFYDYIRKCWKHEYGRIWEEEGHMRMATGGWSANEGIIDAMQDNTLFWASKWQASYRGGLFVFKL